MCLNNKATCREMIQIFHLECLCLFFWCKNIFFDGNFGGPPGFRSKSSEFFSTLRIAIYEGIDR